MKIIMDKDGNEKDVNSVKKIKNIIHDVINNVDIEEIQIELEIQGNSLTWKDWMEYEKFKELNPEVKI